MVHDMLAFQWEVAHIRRKRQRSESTFLRCNVPSNGAINSRVQPSGFQFIGFSASLINLDGSRVLSTSKWPRLRQTRKCVVYWVCSL